MTHGYTGCGGTAIKRREDGAMLWIGQPCEGCPDCRPTPPAPGRAEALLPCPFHCGHVPRLTSRPAIIGEDDWVAFVSCFCGGYSACAHKMAHGVSESEARAAVVELWNRRPAPAIVAEVGDTAKRVKIPADKFEIRWSGDPDVEVVLASDYDAALRTLAEVRGERDQWVARACGLLSMLPDSTTCGEVREAAKPWYEMKAQRDAATQRAEKAEAELLAMTEYVEMHCSHTDQCLAYLRSARAVLTRSTLALPAPATKCEKCGDKLGHDDDGPTICRWCVSGSKASGTAGADCAPATNATGDV